MQTGAAPAFATVVARDFMSRGVDLSFLSAFPHEKEALYPPLTFFRPVRSWGSFKHNGVVYHVVDVEPSFPS